MYYRACSIALVVALCIGCSQVDAPSTVKTVAAFNTVGAPTIEFSLPDMMCEDGCALAVEDILSDPLRRAPQCIAYRARR
jgi:hypothetical protein